MLAPPFCGQKSVFLHQVTDDKADKLGDNFGDVRRDAKRARQYSEQQRIRQQNPSRERTATRFCHRAVVPKDDATVRTQLKLALTARAVILANSTLVASPHEPVRWTSRMKSR